SRLRTTSCGLTRAGHEVRFRAAIALEFRNRFQVNVPLPPGFCVHRGLDALPERLLRSTLAIGNFDGVHAGHKAVIARTREAALDTDTASVALTFEPHPRTFFRPDLPVPRLTPPREKRLLL